MENIGRSRRSDLTVDARAILELKPLSPRADDPVISSMDNPRIVFEYLMSDLYDIPSDPREYLLTDESEFELEPEACEPE